MARLVAHSAAGDLLPVASGPWRLEASVCGPIIRVAPLSGRTEAVSAALRRVLGAGFPTPGTSRKFHEGRILWAGRGSALLLGRALQIEGAVLVDQSSGWTILRLSGPQPEEVLARLCPVDLRPQAFAEDAVVSSLLRHQAALFVRTGAESIEILVARSMTRSAVQNLSRAMGHLAGRRREGAREGRIGPAPDW